MPVPRRTVHDLLAEARAGLVRLSPAEAWGAMRAGAVLVDTRDEGDRDRDGVIPGSVHHPLSTVLWRLDPACETSLGTLPLETEVVLVCREGYSSSIAAAQLRAIGFTRATDVIGGIAGWRRAGLPLVPRSEAAPHGEEETRAETP